jgi:hypothetical protein
MVNVPATSLNPSPHSLPKDHPMKATDIIEILRQLPPDAFDVTVKNRRYPIISASIRPGTMPPAWRIIPETIRAMRDQGFIRIAFDGEEV